MKLYVFETKLPPRLFASIETMRLILAREGWIESTRDSRPDCVAFFPANYVEDLRHGKGYAYLREVEE